MKFIVVTNRRSGSTLLMNLLQKHLKVFAQHETMGNAKKQNLPYAQVAGMLDRFYSRKEALEATATGWKILYEQMYQPIYDYVVARDLKIVHLIRNDLLETALWTRGCTDYDARHINILKRYGKVEANIENTLEYISKLKENIDFWALKADFRILYEGDITNHSESVKSFYNESKRRELLEFLGCEDMELITTTLKKVKLVGKSEDVVSNYRELLEAVENSKVFRYYVDR